MTQIPPSLPDPINPPSIPPQIDPDRSNFANSRSIKRLTNSPTALKIRSFIYKTLSIATKPFNSSLSDYYHFRMKRVDSKLINLKNSKQLDSIFYGHRLPGGINIVQKNAAERQAEIVEAKQELSKQLLAEVQKKHPHSKLSDVASKELLTEGICFGIMVDLADHYLNGDKAEMEHLYSELAKGGSAEAEIYQGAIKGVEAKVSHSHVIDTLYASIDQMKNDATDSTLSKTLPHFDRKHQSALRSVIFNLTTIDTNPPDFMESIRNNETYANMLFPVDEDQETSFMSGFQKSQSEIQQVGLTFLMAKTFETIKNENRSLRTEMHDGKDVLNFSYVQGKLLHELNTEFKKKMENASPEHKSFLIKRREQLIGEIKLAAAAEEYNTRGAISTDPLLKTIFENKSLMINQSTLLALKGLSMSPCTEAMGNHLEFRDDAGYLNNLDNLEPGFYLLSITTKNGGHAVSFIKESDGSGYLIDPNDRKVKFSNNAEAKELANALTSTYSQPETIVPGHPYHKLALFKIDKVT